MALVSIVVPVYHNATSVGELFDRLKACAARHTDDSFEFLFVDDGSRDDSFAALEKLTRLDERVTVVKLTRNFGSMAALRAGIAQSRGEVVAALAADLQDPPELLDAMLERWRQGHKLVLAARRERDDPWLTSLAADCFYSLFRRWVAPNMPARGFDFFLMDRVIRDQILACDDSHVYLMGFLLWLGYEPCVIEYDRQARLARHGRSRWTLVKKLHHFAGAFIAFTPAPLRLASLAGACLLVVALLSLLGGASWLFAAILTVGGLNLVFMGVLGEYLWRNTLSFRRPPFIVDRLAGGEQKESPC